MLEPQSDICPIKCVQINLHVANVRPFEDLKCYIIRTGFCKTDRLDFDDDGGDDDDGDDGHTGPV